MNCNQVNDLISQYIDGDVTPRQASEIQSHVISCRICAESLETLTKAICKMESLSCEEESVDLYAGFRNRLVGKHRTRRFTLSGIGHRRWVTAVAVFVLLLIGSVVGSLLKGDRTLYISNPKSQYSSIYSSIAIAAENAQDRPDVDAPLIADSRLNRVIDITAKGEPLGRVLETMSSRTGVKITAAPDLARQRVYLRLQNMPLSTVMAEIRKLSDSDWVIDGGSKDRSYKLVCSERVKKMASAVAQAQALTHAEKILRKLLEAIETRNPKLLENEGIYGCQGIGPQLEKLNKDPKHQISRNSALLFLIDDEVVSTVTAGQKYRIMYREMSERQRKIFRLSNAAIYSRNKYREYTLTIWMEYGDDGDAKLCIGVGGSGSSSTIGCGLYSPISHHTRRSNRLQTEDVATAYRVESAGNTSYDDPRLHVSLENSAENVKTYLFSKTNYTLPEMLDMIAQRTNLQIVSDYYSINAKYTTIFSSKLTLGEFLAVLEHEFGIAWHLTPDNTLRLVHCQWPVLQQTEPDMKLVSRLNSISHKNNILTMDQIAHLSKLSELQLMGVISQLESQRISSGLSGALSGSNRPEWKFYLSLTPKQKQLAGTKQGLSSDLLNDSQKRLAYEATHGTESGMTPRHLKTKFTFMLFEGIAQSEKLKALANSISGVASFYNGNSPGEEDCGYLRFKGGYEHIIIYTWPNEA